MEKKQRVPLFIVVLLVCVVCLYASAVTMCHRALAEQVNAPVTSPNMNEEISQREVPVDEIIYYSENYSIETDAVSGGVSVQERLIDLEATENPDLNPQTTEQPALFETTEAPVQPEATEEPAPAENTEEPTAPTVTEEPAMPEITQKPERSIVVTDNIGEAVSFGDRIMLTAQLVGYDDVEVHMQWQVNCGSGWEDLPGEQSERYGFVLDQQNINYTFRLAVSVI